MLLIRLYNGYLSKSCRQRPDHVESTGSRPIPEVKQRRARLILGWVTAWEHRVLLVKVLLFWGFWGFLLVYVGFALGGNSMMIFLN